MIFAPPATIADSRPPTGRRRTRLATAVASVSVAGLVLASCGGGDDTADATTTVAATLAPTTTPAPVVTTTLAPAPTTTVAQFVTDGATVVVANASGIDGAAGRMTDAIAIAGFTTTTATNAADSVGQLTTTQVHYVPDSDAAFAVAQSIKTALGGGDIQLVELGSPAPTDSGDLGPATVLVLMGNDIADKTLNELQGVAPAVDESTAEDTAEATSEDG